MFIKDREIGPGHPPYIVAELSANHAGSLGNLLNIMREAKRAGADAVKFQALQADRITLPFPVKGNFMTVQEGPWAGRSLYDLYRQAETPIQWWETIMEEARRLDIMCFPSVFDIDNIPYLEALGCPAYKVSSFELPDTELIKALAATGKPLIMSTGMASGAEISAAISASQGAEFALLHCVSAYPTPLDDMNLGRIRHMRRVYGCPIGLSDHSKGHLAAVVATAMEACIIEKHIMLDRPDYLGPGGFKDRFSAARCMPLDNAFSAQPGEFRDMVEQVKVAWSTFADYEPGAEEMHAPLRRSLFVVEDIKAGEVFTKDNVRSVRPGHGLDPSRLREVLGGIAKVDIERGTPLKMEMVG